MPRTVIRGTQVLDATIQRADLDTSTIGQAVVTKILQGSGILLSSSGADSGTGDVTINAGAPFKGVWDSTTAYLTNDQVIRHGSLYIAIANNTGNDPEVVPTSFSLGQSGTLPQQSTFNNLSCQQIVLSSAATLVSIQMPTYTGAGTNCLFGVYSDVAGVPTTLLASSAVFACANGPNVVSIPGSVVLPAGTYWLVFTCQSGVGSYYDYPGGTAYFANLTWTGSLPTTFPGGGGATAYKYNMLASFVGTPNQWKPMATGGKAGVSVDSGNRAIGGSDGLILVPAIALADNTQNGLLRQVSGLTSDLVDGSNHCQDIATVIRPTIYSVRLRSFNAIGNPNFEVDQRQAGAGVNQTGNNFGPDRWLVRRTASGVPVSWQQGSANVLVPGTNFYISSKLLRFSLISQQASLAAAESTTLRCFIEGPQLRELLGDVTSISILARCTSAFKFGVVLQDVAGANSLSKLASIITPNTWTLIPFPSLPLWPAGATWSVSPGVQGYLFEICLGSGTTGIPSANDVWVSGSGIMGALGQDNFGSFAVNSTFDIAFIQHEPGPLCTQLMDLPFDQNLTACERYFQKTFPLSVKPGTVNANNLLVVYNTATSTSTTVQVPGASFKRRMAKVPTMTAYNYNSGAVNSIRWNTPSDITVSSFNNVEDAGFAQLTLGSAAPASSWGFLHYTADTGW